MRLVLLISVLAFAVQSSSARAQTEIESELHEDISKLAEQVTYSYSKRNTNSADNWDKFIDLQEQAVFKTYLICISSWLDICEIPVVHGNYKFTSQGRACGLAWEVQCGNTLAEAANLQFEKLNTIQEKDRFNIAIKGIYSRIKQRNMRIRSKK